MRRITVLETKKIHDKTKASALVKKLHSDFATLTDEYVSRFQARTVKLLPTILENSKVFGRAVVEVVGQQWAGDQIGILLAGAWSLYHDDAVTYDEALAFVAGQDWSEEKGLEQQTDQMRLVAKLAEQVIRLELGRERSVGELILIAAQETQHYDTELGAHSANDILKRLGIKVEAYADGTREVWFSNTADWIKKILSTTPWGANHSKILARIDGAKACQPSRFAATQSRAVAVPIDIFKD
jgi:putative DNA primase/helicase